MVHLRRRALLGGLAASAGALAGCPSGGGPQDSDDDGVPDDEDYAPQDPEVQSKDDVQGTASVAATESPTATASPTDTQSPTPTPTPTASPTPSPTPTGVDDTTNSLTANSEAYDGQSRLLEYSGASVTLELASYPEVSYDRAKPVAIVYRYPREDAQASGIGDPVDVPTGDERTTVSVRLTDGGLPEDERLHYMLFVIPADATLEEAVEAGSQVHLGSSDPFRIADDRIERDPPDHELGDDSASGYRRRNVEGAYELSFTGSTKGTDWTSTFFVFKTSYTTAVERPRGRSYEEYVALAQKEGFADDLAGILASDAEENGITGAREQVEFVIDFIQNLPYVTDDVSKGFDDYAKTATETIAEANGDCEDTAITLAATLQAEALGYDMVLIQPPGHMAAGIKGDESVEGWYWILDDTRYYYIETTGEGWGIGDLPETYQDEQTRDDTRVHQV